MKSNDLKKRILSAKEASSELLFLSAIQRKKILLILAKKIKEITTEILTANQKDIMNSRRNGQNESFIERLSLDKSKIVEIARSIELIAKGKDDLFKDISFKKMPSGIKIRKTVFPLGLIAIIYESRPNVTLDAFSLCFKSGNAVILKGGKEISHTNDILVRMIKKILEENKINENVIQNFSGINKNLSQELLENKNIDCLIPRGGKNLISLVSQNAKIPIIITGASIVHTYIDESANLELASRVIINAKSRRVSICNALDVVLVHEKIAKRNYLKRI
jgi:glutamate-5-semialdehyde dehydrogenase